MIGATAWSRHHERFYAPLPPALGLSHVVTQPENRGTALGILYPLLRLSTLAPDASVAIFPTDHHVSDDERFAAHVARAFLAVDAEPERVVLLGIIPDTHEAEYGWIEQQVGRRVAGHPVQDDRAPCRQGYRARRHEAVMRATALAGPWWRSRGRLR